MKTKSKKILSNLYGRDELSDSYVSFQINLSEIMEKYRELIKPMDIIFPEKETINNYFESGSPLITFTPISLSLEILTKYCREIISLFLSNQICSNDTLTWFETQADNQFFKEIIEKIISLDREGVLRLSEPTPMDGLTLIMISKELIKPFFQELADQASNVVSYKYWIKGSCPICGDIPSFARFSKEEDGKRYLWCSTCDLEWGFRRICCPFCGNSEHTKLKFLTTNHREELRIDVCENCKGYVKTIDERKIEQEEETIFIKENVASLFLDVVAEENSYVFQLPTVINPKIIFRHD